ncbi:MAG: DegT/DnrJ/EryC1/StrS family aminotransferase [Promethearchaeota archaeon]
MDISQEEKDEVLRVLDSKLLTLLAGNVVETFEREFAEYIGVKHAIGVNSGTAALHTAIASLDIGPGDEVIVSPFTFIATASSVLQNNAIPIFADIDEKTYNIDPESVKEMITERTKAIIPVHLAGISADMDPLMEIAEDYKLYIIEDACQSHGALYKGKKVGSIGHLGTFSFYPSKNMTTGEGGMITTNDDELARQCRLIRHHGEPSWYIYNRLGWNYRMTEIQGAIGRAQLRKLDTFIKKRNENAKYLSAAVENIDGIEPPFIPDYCEPAFNYWIGRFDPEKLKMNKDEFIQNFPKSKVLYPKPLYENELFLKKNAYPKGCPWSCPFYNKKVDYANLKLPVVEQITKEIFALDIYPEISREQLDSYIEVMERLTS